MKKETEQLKRFPATNSGPGLILRKTVCACLALILALTGVYPVPESSAQGLWISRSDGLPVLEYGSPPVFPNELGRFKDAYLPGGFLPGPFILHIQDAHANQDAQKKIHEILKWLADSPGGPLVIGLEGAADTVLPEYLEFFPGDPEVNDAVVSDLLGKGELNGVELFAWERFRNHSDRAGPARVVGIEDESLYRKNLRTYRKLLFSRDKVRKLMVPFRCELETAQTRELSGEFCDFLRERRRRKFGQYEPREDGVGLGEPQWAVYIRYLSGVSSRQLGINLEDRFEQVRFPNLVRVLVVDEVERFLDPDKAREEEQKILVRISETLGARETAEFAENLRRAGSAVSARANAERLWRKAGEQKIDLSEFPQYRVFLGASILRGEIDPAALDAEIAAIEQRLMQSWTRSEAEAKLAARIHDFELVERLLAMKWTAEDYSYFKARPEEILVSAFGGRPEGALRGLIDLGLEFYEGAAARDERMLEKLLASVKDGERAVLVSGGFHTNGLTRLMRERGLGHAVIQPAVLDGDGGSLYRKVMCGEHSDVTGYFRAQVLDEQEGVLFRALLESAVPRLWTAGKSNPGKIARQIAQAVNRHPVLSRRMTASGRARTDGFQLWVALDSLRTEARGGNSKIDFSAMTIARQPLTGAFYMIEDRPEATPGAAGTGVFTLNFEALRGMQVSVAQGVSLPRLPRNPGRRDDSRARSELRNHIDQLEFRRELGVKIEQFLREIFGSDLDRLVSEEAALTGRKNDAVRRGIIGRPPDAQQQEEWPMAQAKRGPPTLHLWIGGGGEGATIFATAVTEPLRQKYDFKTYRTVVSTKRLVMINSGTYDDGGDTGAFRLEFEDSDEWPNYVGSVGGDKMSPLWLMTVDRAKKELLDDSFRIDAVINVNADAATLGNHLTYILNDQEIIKSIVEERRKGEFQKTDMNHRILAAIRSVAGEEQGTYHFNRIRKTLSVDKPFNASVVDALKARVGAIQAKIRAGLIKVPDDWIFFLANMFAMAEIAQKQLIETRDLKLIGRKWQNLMDAAVQIDVKKIQRRAGGEEKAPDVDPNMEPYYKIYEALGIPAARVYDVSNGDAVQSLLLEAATLRIKGEAPKDGPENNIIFQIGRKLNKHLEPGDQIVVRRVPDTSYEMDAEGAQIFGEPLSGRKGEVSVLSKKPVIYDGIPGCPISVIREKYDVVFKIGENEFRIRETEGDEGRTVVVRTLKGQEKAETVPISTSAAWTPLIPAGAKIPGISAISMKSRLVEEQTFITDEILAARPYRLFFKKPRRNPKTGKLEYKTDPRDRKLYDASGSRGQKILEKMSSEEEMPVPTEEVKEVIRNPLLMSFLAGESGMVTSQLPNYLVRGMIEELRRRVTCDNDGENIPFIVYPKLTEDFETMGWSWPEQILLMDRSIKMTFPGIDRGFSGLITDVILPSIPEDILRQQEEHYQKMEKEFEKKKQAGVYERREEKLSKGYPLGSLKIDDKEVAKLFERRQLVRFHYLDAFDFNSKGKLVFDKKELYALLDAIATCEVLFSLIPDRIDREQLRSTIMTSDPKNPHRSPVFFGIDEWHKVFDQMRVMFEKQKDQGEGHPDGKRWVEVQFRFDSGLASQRDFSVVVPSEEKLNHRQKLIVLRYLKMQLYNRMAVWGPKTVEIFARDWIYDSLQEDLMNSSREMGLLSRFLGRYHDKQLGFKQTGKAFQASDPSLPKANVNVPRTSAAAVEKGLVVGLSLSSTHIHGVIWDAENRRVSKKMKRPWTPETFRGELTDYINAILKFLHEEDGLSIERENIARIGIAWPSPIRNNVVINRSGKIVAPFADLSQEAFETQFGLIAQALSRALKNKEVTMSSFGEAIVEKYKNQGTNESKPLSEPTIFFDLDEAVAAGYLDPEHPDTHVLGELGNLIFDTSVGAPYHSYTRVEGVLQQYLSHQGIRRLSHQMLMGGLLPAELEQEFGIIYHRVAEKHKGELPEGIVMEQLLNKNFNGEVWKKPETIGWNLSEGKKLRDTVVDELVDGFYLKIQEFHNRLQGRPGEFYTVFFPSQLVGVVPGKEVSLSDHGSLTETADSKIISGEILPKLRKKLAEVKLDITVQMIDEADMEPLIEELQRDVAPSGKALERIGQFLADAIYELNRGSKDQIIPIKRVYVGGDMMTPVIVKKIVAGAVKRLKDKYEWTPDKVKILPLAGRGNGEHEYDKAEGAALLAREARSEMRAADEILAQAAERIRDSGFSIREFHGLMAEANAAAGSDRLTRIRVAYDRSTEGIMTRSYEVPASDAATSLEVSGYYALLQIYRDTALFGAENVRIDTKPALYHEIEKQFLSLPPDASPAHGFQGIKNYLTLVNEKPFELGLVDSARMDEWISGSAGRKNLPGIPAGLQKRGTWAAIDIGGSDIKGVVLQDGKILSERIRKWSPASMSDPMAPDGHIPTLRALLDELVNAAGLPSVPPIAISINVAVKGDRATGAGLSPLVEGLNTAEARDVVVSMARLFAREYGVDTFLLNDGTALAKWASVELDQPNTLGVSMGTGLAAGYVDSGGRATDYLMEGGNVVLYPAGVGHSVTRVHGAAQQYVSQRPVLRIAAQLGIPLGHIEKQADRLIEVQRLFALGDPRAVEAFRSTARYLAEFVAEAARAVTVDHVVVVGRVTKNEIELGGREIRTGAGDFLIESANRILHAEFPEMGHVRIRVPPGDDRLKELGQAIGAAYYAAEKSSPRSEVRLIQQAAIRGVHEEEVRHLLKPPEGPSRNWATDETKRRALAFAEIVPVTGARLPDEALRVSEGPAAGIYESYETIARLLGVASEEAFAMIVRAVTLERVADPGQYCRVMEAVAVALGPDLASVMNFANPGRPARFVIKKIKAEELAEEDDLLLLAFTLLARPHVYFKIYHDSAGHLPLSLEEIRRRVEENVRRFGGNPSAVLKQLTFEAADFKDARVLRRRIVREALGRYENDIPVVISDDAGFLGHLGYNRVFRMNRMGLSYGRAALLMDAVELRQGIVNMMNMLERQGFSRSEIFEGLGRMMRALQRITTAA